MKRDFDLVRKILFLFRDAPPSEGLHQMQLNDYPQAVVNEHIAILIEGGLLKGRVLGGNSGPAAVFVERLTWAGHDLADAMADDTLWNKAKRELLRPAAAISFDVLLQWLKAELRAKMGLP